MKLRSLKNKPNCPFLMRLSNKSNNLRLIWSNSSRIWTKNLNNLRRASIKFRISSKLIELAWKINSTSKDKIFNFLIANWLMLLIIWSYKERRETTNCRRLSKKILLLSKAKSSEKTKWEVMTSNYSIKPWKEIFLTQAIYWSRRVWTDKIQIKLPWKLWVKSWWNLMVYSHKRRNTKKKVKHLSMICSSKSFNKSRLK